MATRTVTREVNNNRFILVWPKGVGVDDVKIGANGNLYARDTNGEIVQPVAFAAHDMKAAWGFVPESGTQARYVMRKALPKQSTSEKLAKSLIELLKENGLELD